MKEETAEFIGKLRKVIRVLMWLLLVGSFVVFWGIEKYASQLRLPTGGNAMGETYKEPSAEAIREAKRMDWSGILWPWLFFGIAPAAVLRLTLYLIPGGKKKQTTPTDSSGGT